MDLGLIISSNSETSYCSKMSVKRKPVKIVSSPGSIAKKRKPLVSVCINLLNMQIVLCLWVIFLRNRAGLMSDNRPILMPIINGSCKTRIISDFDFSGR